MQFHCLDRKVWLAYFKICLFFVWVALVHVVTLTVHCVILVDFWLYGTTVKISLEWLTSWPTDLLANIIDWLTD